MHTSTNYKDSIHFYYKKNTPVVNSMNQWIIAFLLFVIDLCSKGKKFSFLIGKQYFVFCVCVCAPSNNRWNDFTFVCLTRKYQTIFFFALKKTNSPSFTGNVTDQMKQTFPRIVALITVVCCTLNRNCQHWSCLNLVSRKSLSNFLFASQHRNHLSQVSMLLHVNVVMCPFVCLFFCTERTNQTKTETKKKPLHTTVDKANY